MKATVVAVISILAVILVAAQPGQAVTCGQVDAALMPCISYLTGRVGDSPSPACCSRVKAVKDMAQTTADKKV
ncbi:UNVERIFIED_CONTAM: Non-specific lipid-transfer protein 1 [Sesamum radiatum]|uniref:Non-specific lipid-transfer protein 1 n=1 Tax=Sesamum radiatum TaxID=300843 RepID=A0AAW2VJ80_SESRA